MKMLEIVTISALWLAVLFAPNASAQENSPARKAPGSGACEERLKPGGTLPESDKSLSERLAESRGVVCPTHRANPEIRVPPPEKGEIEVIPPPGG